MTAASPGSLFGTFLSVSGAERGRVLRARRRRRAPRQAAGRRRAPGRPVRSVGRRQDVAAARRADPGARAPRADRRDADQLPRSRARAGARDQRGRASRRPSRARTRPTTWAASRATRRAAWSLILDNLEEVARAGARPAPRRGRRRGRRAGAAGRRGGAAHAAGPVDRRRRVRAPRADHQRARRAVGQARRAGVDDAAAPRRRRAVADIIERSAVQSGTPFETGLAAAVAADLVRERALPAVRRPAGGARDRRPAAGVAAPLPPQRRPGGAAGAVAGGRLRARRAARSRAARCSRPARPDGVSEADLGAPTRRGRNRGAEALAALQARGLLVAHTRGRKEVFALAHPALREIDRGLRDRRSRARRPTRAGCSRAGIATGERLRVPRALRRSPPPARDADARPSAAAVRRGLGGAGDAVQPGRRRSRCW